jgi:RNA polymerase primary sigma factor
MGMANTGIRSGNSGKNAKGNGSKKSDAFFSDEVPLYNMYRLPLMNTEEINASIRRIQNGDPQEEKLRREMVLRNQGLVRVFAKHFVGRGVSMTDLLQEGMIGLNTAIDRFDESRDVKFSTYATYWIREGIRRVIANEGRTIRVPVHQFDRALHLIGIQQTLQAKYGREPTIYEIYRVAKDEEEQKNEQRSEEGKEEQESVTLFGVSSALRALENGVLSLDWQFTADESDSSTMYDFLPDTEHLSPEDLAHLRGLHGKICLLFSHILRILERFPAKESEVLLCRFGLIGERKKTLHLLGEKLNVSRERIRQIQQKALQRLERQTNLSPDDVRRLLLAKEEIECVLAS